MKLSVVLKTGAAGLVLAALAQPAGALVLTSDGVNDGFTLALFADQFPTYSCCGPLGIATNSNGQIVIQDYGDGVNAVFNDVNNQHFSDAVSSAPFASFNYGTSITNSGGTLYATHDSAGGYVQVLNPDGSFNSNLTTSGIGKGGIWTNPVNGHLLVAGYSAVWDVTPSNGSATLVTNTDVDGVSVSVDGSTVYGATGGHILGWKISDGTLVYDSGYLGSPDGTAVIYSTGLFKGDIIANDNDGTVRLLDPNAMTDTIIADLGTRGDYVGLDLNDGSLLLTQSTEVYKLSCGTGCSFVQPSGVPEPATLALFGLGLLGLGAQRRRRAALR